jgi:hypothetical protein
MYGPASTEPDLSDPGYADWAAGCVASEWVGNGCGFKDWCNMNTNQMEALIVEMGWARCAFFGRNLHSRMPLDPTPARLKRADV